MTGEDLIRKAIHSDSTEELLELSKVVDPEVRYQVLLRYQITPESIRNAVNIAIRRGVHGISDDGPEVDYEAETEILVEAAGMPETPSDILEKLLGLHDFPWHVLTNPGLSDAFLRKALHGDQCRWDEDGEIVEMLIAFHPNATAGTLGQIWEKVSVLPPEEIAKNHVDAYRRLLRAFRSDGPVSATSEHHRDHTRKRGECCETSAVDPLAQQSLRPSQLRMAGRQCSRDDPGTPQP